MNVALCAMQAPDRARRRAAVLVALLTLVGALMALAACSSAEPTIEERAYALDRELMCPVCDGQNLDQSHAQIAQDMKAVIRERLVAGESEQQIKDYFVLRYGDAVLGAPPAEGFNLLAWIAPPVIAAGGLAIVVVTLRRLRRRQGPPEPLEEDASLAPYLAIVDADTGNTGPEGARG